MRLTRRHFLQTASAAALPLPAVASATGAGRKTFRRGGAIHTMMNWGALEEGSSDRYQPQPFEAPRNVFPQKLVRDFAKSGFDFIRLTLDVGPFMQLHGRDLEGLEAKLLHNIGLVHAEGLGVIVDCHPVEQVPAYSVQAILDDLDGQPFADYAAMIGRLAALLSSVRGGPVALELMNEPALRDAPHWTQVNSWAAAQLVLHDAARRAAPGLKLVLTGGHYGGIQGLIDSDPAPYLASNTLFSFHYYMPIAFTHQGISAESDEPEVMPQVVDLPYPADALPADEIWRRIEARIAADALLDDAGRLKATFDARRIMAGYLLDPWNRQRIEADIGRVAEWADASGVARDRIILGECGVTRRDWHFTGVDPASRGRWLSDLRNAAENAGFAWAVWEIQGREFGIDDPQNPDRVDPAVLSALGLSA